MERIHKIVQGVVAKVLKVMNVNPVVRFTVKSVITVVKEKQMMIINILKKNLYSTKMMMRPYM